MRRRPHGQFQRGAGGAVPEPWRGRGAAGRGAGAVARNHAGRGSRCDGVPGEGGGAARAVARAPARVARAGREREGREREWRGAGSAARGPGPRVGRRARQGVARIYRGSHSIGGGGFVLKEICREETLFTALFFRRKYLLWRCALVCERLRCEPWRPWGFTAQACAAKSRRAASGAPYRHACGSAPTPSARLRSKRAARETLSLSDSWTAPWPRGRA
jgi:hypothetical protein